MAKMTREQWQQYAAQWKRAAPELDRIRREELANWKYDARIVSALLEIGAKMPYNEKTPSGLMILQQGFMKLAVKQGLLPAKVDDKAAARESKRQ